jgi:serine/threonine protein kinase
VGEKSAIKDPNLGTVVDGRYQLLENVGSGGSSTVYRALDSKSNRILALKLLHNHFVTDQLIVDRFKREAETSNLLRHPNVVEVESWAVSASGQVYMTEEFVEGISLQDAIAEHGWLSVELALGIAAQVASGLVAAHEMGVVHCDLKPGNIMLTRSPEGMLLVKVLDFGIAKVMPQTGDTVLRLTQSGNMQGSLLYMSPEQCLDEDLDGRSDVYSLACVIYEALTGKSPLCARTAFETMNRHLNVMPAPLATVRSDLRWPDKLEATLSRAYAKKPKDRYQSMAKFQTALKKVIDLPIEIEWPERWTARSERIEADLKDSEILPSVPVSVETITSMPPPVVIPKLLEPKQAIELLVKDLVAIPRQFGSVLIGWMIFAMHVFAAVVTAFQPGSSYIPAIYMIVAFFLFSLVSTYWNGYLDLKSILLLKKVSLKNAPAFSRKLEARRISIVEAFKLDGNFYEVTFEVDDSSAIEKSEKVTVRKASSGLVWRSLETKDVKAVAAKPSAARSVSKAKLQYPISGYSFYDEKGEILAISILSDVGWIYTY